MVLLHQRIYRFIVISMLAIFSVQHCPWVSAQSSERTRKVLDDKRKVTQEGFWIYNDFPAALKISQQTGKPLLVVLRCLPCVECVKLDDEVVDRDPIIRPLLEQFVCVRIVSTNGLDLSLFQFDTDQSFAAFMLRDEKTIYGRFGTRSHRTDWVGDVSLAGMAEALRGALRLHNAWPEDQLTLAKKLGPAPSITRPELFPSLKEKFAYTSSLDYAGDVVKSCIHCHQIGDAVRDEYRAGDGVIPEAVLYPYPHPKSIGIVLDPRTTARIKSVEPESPAAQAGLLANDLIERIDDQPILSMADVQWVLHSTSPDGAVIEMQIDREGETKAISLTLDKGWRRAGDISWRVSTWGLRRMALGGLKLESLGETDRDAASIAPGTTALRVAHVGQYGPHARAKNAGFQVGDIIVSIDGMSEFQSESDVIRYGVTEKKPNQPVTFELFRNGARKSLTLLMQ